MCIYSSGSAVDSYSYLDGTIAIAIALYGAIVFPDTPSTTKAFYLNSEERELARRRISPRLNAKLDKAAVKNIFLGWRYWMFSLLFVVTSQLEACVSVVSVLPTIKLIS